LYDDPGITGLRRHALVKGELTAAHKHLFLALSYAQSGFGGSGENPFFPSGNFEWEKFDGDNFSSVLPTGGAGIAEVRISPIRIRDIGNVRITWRYEAIREEFLSDLGSGNGNGIGHTTAAYFRSGASSLNARILYHTSVRSVLEHEKRRRVDAGVWGILKNGLSFLIRGSTGEIEDRFVLDSKQNFIHGALRYQTKKIRSDAHIMWKDLDTVFSERRFAWDGRVGLSPDFGLHWRLLLSRDFDVGRSAYWRLEYRPNNRIFAYLSYGRSFLGDDPFVLEDRDLGLARAGTSQIMMSLRGDF
jgi:hypothetical protein